MTPGSLTLMANILKMTFCNEKFSILIKISQNFVHGAATDNKYTLEKLYSHVVYYQMSCSDLTPR